MDNKYTNTDIFKTTECPSDALLLSYVKETIGKEDKRLVELHIVDCEMCNDMVEGFQRMDERKLENHLTSINSEIDFTIEQYSRKGIITPKYRWYYAAAAILIIGLTGILYNIYFNSLDQTKVADLPMPHQNEISVAIDTAEKDDAKEPENNPTIKVIKALEPVKSVVIESKNKRDTVLEDATALSEISKDDAAAAPVEQKVEEKSVVAFDAETTTKALSDNITFSNSSIAQPAFAGSPNTEMLSNGAATTLINPSTQLEAVDFKWTDGKKRNSNKKESLAKSKSKADKPAAAVKNEEESEKQSEGAANERLDSVSSKLLIDANQLLMLKNYNAALNKFKAYLVNNPKNCEAVNGAAQCYDATNKIADAIIYYTKLSQLKCAKRSEAAYLKLSELYIKNQQPEQAKQILQKAMQSKYLDIAEQAKKELDKL